MPKFNDVVAALQYWVQIFPDTPVFIFRDKHHQRNVLTWKSLYTLSGRFAAVLRSDGVGRGSLVVNSLINSPERVITDTGIMMSGAASVNGQCLLADGSDLLRTLRMSRAGSIIVDPDIPNSPWNVLKDHVTLDKDNNVSSDSLPDLKKVYLVRRVEDRAEGDFLAELEKQQDWFQADDITADDVIYVFATSGTTGFSKLVVHSHGNLTGLANNESGKSLISWASQVTEFCSSPLGWIASYSGLVILLGKTRTLCDLRAGAPEEMEEFFWRCIQEEKCSQAAFSPMYLRRLEDIANKQKNENKESDSKLSPVWKMKVILLYGLPVNQSMIKAGLSLAESVCVSYGSTDLDYMSEHLVTDFESYIDHDSGLPIESVEVRIVNQEDEKLELPINQLGHILIRTPFAMLGYLNDPQATAAAFTKDGFFRTGDLGRLDDRGHLIVDGRGNDAIMRGNYIFYPYWIEKRISECPCVRDIIVVGVPDSHFNEELCACLILEPNQTMEEVRNFVEKDIVASESDPLSPRPRYYLRFESFPLSSTNKPQRHALKKMAAKQLSL